MNKVTNYEHDECQELAPKTINFYITPFTDGLVAHCSDCRFTSVFWECNCKLEHDCGEYPATPEHLETY